MRIDDAYPVETGKISGRLDACNIGEFNETIGSDADTEAPSLRFAGFEIGKFFIANEIHQNIAGMTIQTGCCARELAANLF